jgi:GT2 family glycosyltransferase
VKDAEGKNKEEPSRRDGVPKSMLFVILANAAVFITGLALVMTIINLRLLRVPAPWTPGRDGSVPDLISVCVPARNEESNLRECVERILANDYPNLEVLVYDDQSTDATPRILAELQAADPRVKAVPSVPLPAGWNGKQHACWRMSRAAGGVAGAGGGGGGGATGGMGQSAGSDGARHWLVFTDADVRFERDCLSRARGAAHDLDAPLVSTFPRQLTGTLAEALVVPMIFFILLSYLPFPQMRKTLRTSASAGCGQFLFIRRDVYEAAGTHEAFKDSMHDGIKLPRAVRKAGFKSDLFDGSACASVRMYQGLRATWRGFAKNAYEGLGSVPLLVFVTVTHLIGHVLPWLIVLGVGLLAIAGLAGFKSHADHPDAWMIESLVESLSRLGFANPVTIGGCVVAIALAIEQRLRIARHTRTSIGVIPLHPVAVLMMTAIQWHSFLLHITGLRSWRGRVLSESPAVVPTQPTSPPA